MKPGKNGNTTSIFARTYKKIGNNKFIHPNEPGKIYRINSEGKLVDISITGAQG